jgi:predicted acyltransferase
MPYSFARRWAKGESWDDSLRHVLKRAALLIAWGLVARSVQAGRPNLDLINVLAQIAFTYTVAFLLLRKSWKVQAAAALAILLLHTLIYLFVRIDGVQGPWVRDGNIGQALDLLILGKTWGGSYATINCLSSTFNTILGVLAGRLLFSGEELARKTRILAMAGVVLIVAGLGLHPFVPIIKKIWTASFALLSGGITLLTLLAFYWICDVWKKQRWATIFVMIGANSIFIYLFHEILGGWMRRTAPVFTSWAEPFVGTLAPFTAVWLAIGLQVYVCYWLYQRRIFFKL